MIAGIADGINKLSVKEVPIPAVPRGKALVRVAYAGLCGPTDDAILRGLHPRAVFPLVLGHEFSGELAEVPPDATAFKKYDRVAVNPLIFCNDCEICREGNQYICKNLKLIGIDFDGGFQEYCLVPVENLVRIPDSLPLNIAALAEPMAVGVHAAVEAGVGLGDSILIYGAGPIGLFVAEACRYAGARKITVADIDKNRLELSQSLGFSTFDNSGHIHNNCEAGYDVVFETTGSEKVMQGVLKKVRIKGKVIIVGKFDNDVPFDFHTVLFNEITLKGVRVYREKEFLSAVDILSREPYRYEKYISDYFPLEKINGVFETFRSRRNLSRIMISFN